MARGVARQRGGGDDAGVPTVELGRRTLSNEHRAFVILLWGCRQDTPTIDHRQKTAEISFSGDEGIRGHGQPLSMW